MGPYLYEKELLFSALRERRLRFAMVWKKWSIRCIRITSAGELMYIKPALAKEDPLSVKVPKFKKFLLHKIFVSMMTDADLDQSSSAEVGLLVKCQTLDHIESYFRLVIPYRELQALLDAFKSVAKEHNVDNLQQSRIQTTARKTAFSLRSGQSAMRRTVSLAMDVHDRRSKQEQILAKRGAFKWLPAAMANDLIHGSWWFTWGSAGVVITCIIVIENKYDLILSDDDSLLDPSSFVASWILMLVSGIFCTLGSLAFVRAFHEDPPMTPLFTAYHLQSDELVASWLFFLSTVPFAPYVLLYLSSEGFGSLLYLAALAFACIASIGALLFVRACYPSDASRTDLLLPISRVFCCCSLATREHYFINDWLGASWLFYWASAFATFCSGILLIYQITRNDSLQIWVMATSFLESLMFTIGSAYFVAGSYPEVSASHASSSKIGRSEVDEGNSDDEDDEQQGQGQGPEAAVVTTSAPVWTSSAPTKEKEQLWLEEVMRIKRDRAAGQQHV